MKGSFTTININPCEWLWTQHYQWGPHELCSKPLFNDDDDDDDDDDDGDDDDDDDGDGDGDGDDDDDI